MRKSIINSLVMMGFLSCCPLVYAEDTANTATAEYICPTLHANEMYFPFEWVDIYGNKIEQGAWNTGYWRLWINGDSYFTPKTTRVYTNPLAAHFFASTNTWYLKCVSADLDVGPRTNVWNYTDCKINPQKTGFICTYDCAVPTAAGTPCEKGAP